MGQRFEIIRLMGKFGGSVVGVSQWNIRIGWGARTSTSRSSVIDNEKFRNGWTFSICSSSEARPETLGADKFHKLPTITPRTAA